MEAETPFFVRVNMVLVDGSDVKKKYLEIIDDIRLFLEKSIRDSIIVNS